MTDSRSIFRGATLLLEIFIVAIGSHAYFDSPWNKEMREPGAYEACQAEAASYDKTCPPLALETYFISISIISLILTIGFITISFFVENDTIIKRVESFYNIHAGLLIVGGGITLIISALKINELASVQTNTFKDKGRNEFQYFDEKIAAGILSLINGLVFAALWIKGYKTSTIPYVRQ